MAAIIFAATTTDFSARAETRGFAQSGFTALRVSSGLEMVVEVGPAFSIVAEGETEAIDTVDIHTEGTALVVDRKHNWRETLFSWSSVQQRVLLRVPMPRVSAMAADAGARIEISGDISQPVQATASAGAALRLKRVDGADVAMTARAGASVMADGTCGTLQAEASGGSVFAHGAGGLTREDMNSGGSITVKR